ncbi:MAG TPA: NAD-dependent epimerase/dehydratase family protein [Candidatus Eisenbacteria bacterium]|jgi:nucleoside-diphosphate-sugar epimerase|nr:NAD-dependent epimerase/dehydratase family protein [Candidatus Eisenbacteria bacterium]
MITILGAGGVISNEVVKLLCVNKQPFRLVARRAPPAPRATETISADLSDKDQTIRAVAGSSIVYVLVGLKYDHRLWAEMWPRIMANTIEACKRSGAKLIFFDNVYMYGKATGTMTEETPFNPCSKKGETRAKIAISLINEWKNGGLTAMIARAADFYGPEAPNGLPNVLVFEPLAKNQKASWLANDSVPHSYTYTLDAARSLVTLAESESTWNQTWHVATTPNPPTGKEFIAMAAKEFGVAPRLRVLSRTMVRVMGWFNPLVGEVHEMLYQNDSPYLFDSSKIERAFSFSGTPYAEGIRTTAASLKNAAPSPK